MRFPLSLLFLLFLLSCSRPSPTWENIDWQVWKNDRDACKNERAQFAAALAQQKEKLKALSEMEIISLMGKPDQNELYKRNQKFYYYFLQPGLHCGKTDSLAQRLVIRFNAMGYAKDVSIE